MLPVPELIPMFGPLDPNVIGHTSSQTAGLGRRQLLVQVWTNCAEWANISYVRTPDGH